MILLVTNQDETMSEVEGAKVDADTAKEFVFTIKNIVKDVKLSQSVCESHEDGAVMIDNGASVNLCSKWFGKSGLEKSDGSVRHRGADGRTLQDQIWLRIGNHLKQCDFHVVDVTKPFLSVGYLWDSGIETENPS